MKRMMLVLCGLFGGVVLLETAEAQVVHLSPSEAVVLPAEEGQPTRLALRFDLSGIPSGEGRTIDAAVIDWRFDGAPEETPSRYQLFGATGSWTSADVAGGSGVSADEAASAEWDLEPVDVDRLDGGFVRFEVTDLVIAWTSGGRTNYGVVIAAPDLARGDVADDVAAPVLTVYYGFNKE